MLPHAGTGQPLPSPIRPNLRLLVYQPKPGHELDDDAWTDPLEFLARVLIHVPEPNKHLVHFYGAYANRVRSKYPHQVRAGGAAKPMPPRRTLNKRLAELIYRICEVDPLTCTQCGAEMKILAFITEHATIKKSSTTETKRIAKGQISFGRGFFFRSVARS